MKTQIALFVGCLTILISEIKADCDKLPEDLQFEGCCKFPPMGEEATVKKVAESFKDQKLDEFMMECKISDGIFKELKISKADGTVDKDALMKHLDDSMKDATWKAVMKGAGEECFKEITTKKDEIANELEKAPFNIKKDQCNVQSMSMVTCVHIAGFVKCPKESWTDDKKCNDAKAWIEKCGDSIDSMKQLVSKKSSKK